MSHAPFVRIDDQWTRAGLPVVVLENSFVRVVVCPTLGARVLEIEHRASGENLLWQNPRIEHRAVPIGTSYDDNFAGGWDELFPNDLAGRVGDEQYPDHGELWCQPWQHRIEHRSADEVTLYLHRTGACTPTTVEKWITLRADERQLRFRHRFTNHGHRTLNFLWKLHPAMAIDAGDRIDVPGARGELVDPTFGRARADTPFAWPAAPQPDGTTVDLSVVPPLDGTRDFVYVSELTAGWCAIRRLQHDIGFGLVFPLDVFPSVWLFMTFGGWRGLSTAVLEPCTTVPKDLNEAIRRGTDRRLAPGESLECEVRAVVFDGSAPVQGFTAHGMPIR
jgi:galactose mutarotase-like enzyme